MGSMTLVLASVLFTSSISVQANDPSYVAVATDGVAFIQWTESSGRLSGQYQALSVNEYDPLRLDNVNAAFSGVRSGPAVTLTFSGFLSSTTVTGTLEGGTLTLVVPNANGLLVKYVFKAGSVDDYNRAAQALRKRVERQATLASQRKAVTAAQAEFNDDYNTLRRDTLSLAQETDFSLVLKEYEENWTTMQKDYAVLRTDASKNPLTCDQLGTVEADLGTIEADLGSIEAANGSSEVVRESVLSEVRRTNQDIRNLQSALEQLRNAVGADLTKTIPSPKVYLDQVSRLLSESIADSGRQIQLSGREVQMVEAQVRDYNSKATELLRTATDFVKTLSCGP